MQTQTLASEVRKTEYSIEPIFTNRWSPRAMTGDAITRKELMPLFEAARWAPSSFNNQSWRFYYALRNSTNWPRFLDLLEEFNRGWARNAGALVVIASKKTHDKDGKPARTHSFDTGAAWAYFALQGSASGLAVHGMEGFDYEKAKTFLSLSDEYQVEAMAAVGHRGDREMLPQHLQALEKPSSRKKLSEFVFDAGILKT